jgi:hypothetical protein
MPIVTMIFMLLVSTVDILTNSRRVLCTRMPIPQETGMLVSNDLPGIRDCQQLYAVNWVKGMSEHENTRVRSSAACNTVNNNYMFPVWRLGVHLDHLEIYSTI